MGVSKRRKGGKQHNHERTSQDTPTSHDSGPSDRTEQATGAAGGQGDEQRKDRRARGADKHTDPREETRRHILGVYDDALAYNTNDYIVLSACLVLVFTVYTHTVRVSRMAML